MHTIPLYKLASTLMRKTAAIKGLSDSQYISDSTNGSKLSDTEESFNKMVDLGEGHIHVGPNEALEDGLGFADFNTGNIYVRDKNPHVLAHELGHLRSLGSLQMLASSLLGRTGNAVHMWPLLKRPGTWLQNIGTRMKEKAADSYALDIWKDIGATADEIEHQRQLYAQHHEKVKKWLEQRRHKWLAKNAAIKGLPDRNDYGDLSKLTEDEIAYLVRQRHRADRAGLHEDLRIGTPSGLYSWAVPKFIPEVENDRRLAIQQPLHQWSYKDFQGRLGHGYGKGTVEKMEESPVVILKNTGDHIMFTRGDSKDAPIYNLRRTRDKNWLLFIKRKDQPLQIKTYPKEHFKEVPMDKVPELIANGAAITKKIDGAGTLLYLGPHGVEAYGIRTGANGFKPEYTDVIGGLRSIRVPKDIQGTVLRGEVYGKRGARSIGANELAGLLNATTMNAVNKRKATGAKLLVAALAVNKGNLDDYDAVGLQHIVDALGTDKVHTVDRYTGQAAMDVLKKLKAGTDPLTHEGVVVHQQGKRPLKAKFKDDADVVIRNIFKADTDADNRAGGFEYSLPGSEDIVGRVGTGFTHEMLRDMLRDPDSYIGRTARIHAQEQYPSGAYRAPGFIAMKED